FRRNLENAAREGCNWLPDPFHFANDCYFGTDDVDFHHQERTHTARLEVTMNLEIARIGRMSAYDRNDIFCHSPCGTSDQHSDLSHRIRALIQAVPKFSGGMDVKFDPNGKKYVGICDKVAESKAAKEVPLDIDIRNTLSGTYFSQQGRNLVPDTTILEVSASAAYPFLPVDMPKINFNLRVKLHRTQSNIEITMEGEHNDFPAYELIIGKRIVYNYDPSKHGYNGPTPYNLGMASTKFRALDWVKIW
ncbi:MAG: hypothetical protein RLZZ165_1041, partial [Bacteroidota bacterium]